MNEVLSFLTGWLMDLLVLGTVLLAVACFLLVIIRQPVARMAVSRGTLLGLAILCVLTSLPYWPRQSLVDLFSRGERETEVAELLPSPPESGAAFPAPLMIHVPLLAEDESFKSLPPTSSLSVPALINLLPMLWLGAASFALAYIALGACRAFCLLRTASKAPGWSQQELDRLVSPKDRPPRLKASERIATAVALLAWRPHILLAARSMREDNKSAVRAALAHEWAHIRHGDLWLLALERLLLPVFCLHPLFWLLRRHIRIDQELLADAAAAGDAPVEYAQALLNWAKAENSAAAPGFGIAALSLWDHPSSLSRRVEMLLHPQPCLAAGRSRLWKWLAPPALVAAVLGLSLITLRPAAVAQDDTFMDVDIQPRPQKIKKTKKAKPKNAEAKRRDATTDQSKEAAPPAGAQIFLELLVGQVDHAVLEKAESSLGDLIQAASEDHCRLEGNLIVAELSPQQYSTLTVELKKADALTILSRPRLVTLDGQEATVQIGSQVPLATLEETVNGDPRRRVEYREVGETIVIRPIVSDKDPTHLMLDIVAQHSELDQESGLKAGDDTLRFIENKFQLEAEAVVGKFLIITERQPKKGSGRGHSILLAIGPQKIVPPAQVTERGQTPPSSLYLTDDVQYFAPGPETRSSDDLKRLRDENALLHKQITDLQAKLNDREVQIRSLRAAATPGGGKKVSDEVFLRRVYLDLTGILPTADETRAFLKDEDKQKRDKLIDRLLEGNSAKNEIPHAWNKLKSSIQGEPKPDPPAPRRESDLHESIWRRLGVKLTAMPESDLKQLHSRYRGGLKVLEVRESGPAGQQGIRSGDVLVGLHKWETISLDNIAFILERDEVLKDERVDYYVIRGTESVRGQICLAKQKPAAISPAPMETEQDSTSIQVFRLSRSRAEAVAQVLAKVLPRDEGLVAEVDERTNSLILRGSAKAMQKARALLEALDRELEFKEDAKEPASQEKGTSLPGSNDSDPLAATVKLRVIELQVAESALQSAETALASSEKLAAKGFLSPLELARAKVAVAEQMIAVKNAKSQVENAKTASANKP
jgi:beta-lactamase regulating signal transducer with metallopeptidase domain